jgi:hypothetical protein
MPIKAEFKGSKGPIIKQNQNFAMFGAHACLTNSQLL